MSCTLKWWTFPLQNLQFIPKSRRKGAPKKKFKVRSLTAEVKANFHTDKATILNHWSKYHFWKNGSPALHIKHHKFFTCCWEQSKFPQKLHYKIITLYNNKGVKSDHCLPKIVLNSELYSGHHIPQCLPYQFLTLVWTSRWRVLYPLSRMLAELALRKRKLGERIVQPQHTALTRP